MDALFTDPSFQQLLSRLLNLLFGSGFGVRVQGEYLNRKHFQKLLYRSTYIVMGSLKFPKFVTDA